MSYTLITYFFQTSVIQISNLTLIKRSCIMEDCFCFCMGFNW